MDFQDSIYLRRMGIFRIGISHDDRDGGSKCVTTGSICVPMVTTNLSVDKMYFEGYSINR